MCQPLVFWACESWNAGAGLRAGLIGVACHQRPFVSLVSRWKETGFVCLFGRQIRSLGITHVSRSIPFLSWGLSQFLVFLHIWFYFFTSMGLLLFSWLNDSSFLLLLTFTLAASPSWHLFPFTFQHFSDILLLTELSAADYFSLYIFAFFSNWNLIRNVTVCT